MEETSTGSAGMERRRFLRVLGTGAAAAVVAPAVLSSSALAAGNGNGEGFGDCLSDQQRAYLEQNPGAHEAVRKCVQIRSAAGIQSSRSRSHGHGHGHGHRHVSCAVVQACYVAVTGQP